MCVSPPGCHCAKLRARCPAVSVTTGPDEERIEPTAGTLGALLFADKAKARISEAEWVGLVRAIAKGDQQALHALYERAHRIVFTLTMRITKDRHAAEELTLDVFHDVWRRAPQYDPAGGTVIGWIMNQARSRAIDRLRFDQRKKRVNPHSDDPTPDLVELDAGAVAMLREQREILRHALAVLTPAERQAIEAAFFSGFTYAEVAQELNQPLGTVKTRIRSALAKLRQALGMGELQN